MAGHQYPALAVNGHGMPFLILAQVQLLEPVLAELSRCEERRASCQK